MVQNAQLDNEKSAISYQVDLYKDKFLDLEATFYVLQVSYAFSIQFLICYTLQLIYRLQYFLL